MITQPKQSINITIEDLKKISSVDLADLLQHYRANNKGGWRFWLVRVPSIDVLKKYWNELLLIKTNKLIVGRLNGAIAGTLLLSFSTPNNEAQKNIAKIQSHFVAPWARGYGLAKAMIDFTENVSRENDTKCIQLDVRETQEAAIKLFKTKGYKLWGENPHYAFVNGNFIKGIYFYKKI